ncbi:organic acid transporter [Starmerella bacillaris]|uniref:Organic acid transporter n=1 Tax=Starmerella bacillaris TaxID=1247836 RepID=A0AAV5RMS2_STABA|nr:organic acid transporter [Starmerella bacillaris]
MATHVDPQYLEVHETPQEIETPNAWKDILAGTVGGIAQVLSGQPFDTTKVRLQSAPEGTYDGAMDVVRQLLKNEGVAGFYKGTMTPLIGVGACVSVQFAVNEGMKRYFEKQNGPSVSTLSYSQLYCSGAMAGFANSFLASPIEQVRIRLQTQTADSLVKFNGPIDAISKIIKYGGIGHGLFRGLVPTLIREVHGMGVYFLAAEACIKHEMDTYNKTRAEIPSWHVCAYGGVAGVSMWVSAYPIDVIKSRFQTDALNPKDRLYTSMWDCYKKTTAKGTSAIFRGFMPTILRAVPVNAVTFLAFDYTRRMLGP